MPEGREGTPRGTVCVAGGVMPRCDLVADCLCASGGQYHGSVPGLEISPAPVRCWRFRARRSTWEYTNLADIGIGVDAGSSFRPRPSEF